MNLDETLAGLAGPLADITQPDAQLAARKATYDRLIVTSPDYINGTPDYRAQLDQSWGGQVPPMGGSGATGLRAPTAEETYQTRVKELGGEPLLGVSNLVDVAAETAFDPRTWGAVGMGLATAPLGGGIPATLTRMGLQGAAAGALSPPGQRLSGALTYGGAEGVFPAVGALARGAGKIAGAVLPEAVTSYIPQAIGSAKNAVADATFGGLQAYAARGNPEAQAYLAWSKANRIPIDPGAMLADNPWIGKLPMLPLMMQTGATRAAATGVVIKRQLGNLFGSLVKDMPGAEGAMLGEVGQKLAADQAVNQEELTSAFTALNNYATMDPSIIEQGIGQTMDAATRAHLQLRQDQARHAALALSELAAPGMAQAVGRMISLKPGFAGNLTQTRLADFTAASNALYDKVRQLIPGPVEAPTVAATAKAIAEREAAMGNLRYGTPSRIADTLSALAGDTGADPVLPSLDRTGKLIPLSQLANEDRDTYVRMGILDSGGKLTAMGSKELAQYQSANLDQPVMTWDQLDQLRKRVGDVYRNMRFSKTSANNPQTMNDLGIVGEMFKAVNQDVEAVLARPELAGAKEAFDLAQENWKRTILDVYRKPEVSKMLRKDPSLIVGAFSAPGNSLETLSAVRKAIGEQGYVQAQSVMANDLVTNATTAGQFDLNQWRTAVDRYSPEQQQFWFGNRWDEFQAFKQAADQYSLNPTGKLPIPGGPGVNWSAMGLKPQMLSSADPDLNLFRAARNFLGDPVVDSAFDARMTTLQDAAVDPDTRAVDLTKLYTSVSRLAQDRAQLSAVAGDRAPAIMRWLDRVQGYRASALGQFDPAMKLMTEDGSPARFMDFARAFPVQAEQMRDGFILRLNRASVSNQTGRFSVWNMLGELHKWDLKPGALEAYLGPERYAVYRDALPSLQRIERSASGKQLTQDLGDVQRWGAMFAIAKLAQLGVTAGMDIAGGLNSESSGYRYSTDAMNGVAMISLLPIIIDRTMFSKAAANELRLLSGRVPGTPLYQQGIKRLLGIASAKLTADELSRFSRALDHPQQGPAPAQQSAQMSTPTLTPAPYPTVTPRPVAPGWQSGHP